MRVRRVAWLSLAALVVAGAAALYAIVFRDGLSADRAPNAIEAAVAPRLVALSIPAATRARTNPHRADADAWRTAAEHFGAHAPSATAPMDTVARRSRKRCIRRYPISRRRRCSD
jgi:hypothetical protein